MRHTRVLRFRSSLTKYQRHSNASAASKKTQDSKSMDSRNKDPGSSNIGEPKLDPHANTQKNKKAKTCMKKISPLSYTMQ